MVEMVKLQDPTSKLQRSSKLQIPAGETEEYPEGFESSWRLEEGAAARHPFDLEERTARFSEALIALLRAVPRGPHTDRLIDQLMGCGTSIGANYSEANE